MTDIPNDDSSKPEGEEKAGASNAPWQPATDAGTEAVDPKAGPRPRKAAGAKKRAAPSGEQTLRRRAAPGTTAEEEMPSEAKPKAGAKAKVEAKPKAGAEAAPEADHLGAGELQDEAPPVSETGSEPVSETGMEPVAAEPVEIFAGERVAKAIARAGLASRRDAEAMILDGRVSVNGEVIASPALNVTDDDVIVVDGEPLPMRERTRLWIFHKPRGLVTTARDPEGRQTVFEVLPEDMPRVVAVGRLDINTEGLLLLTNDGGLAKVIAHPDTGWLRRYRVRAHGDTDQAQLDRLAKGVTIDGMEYGPIEATLDRVQGDNLWLTLGLREGKNREVKRILEHLGLYVNRLIRLSFGPFQLGDLEVGLVEEVRTRVLKDQLGKSLAEQAGVDFESPVREPISPFGGPAKASRGDSAAPRAQPRRDAARPAPQKVSTGGTGPNLRRSVWRADEGEGPNYRPGRVPRRGSDPREAQAAVAAERGRERVGAIKAGDRRVLVERLSPKPAQPVQEEAPRRRYSKAGAAPAQGGERREGYADRGGSRPFRSRDGNDTGAPRGGGFGRDEGASSHRGERAAGPRRDGAASPRGRSGERNEGGGFQGRTNDRSQDRRNARDDGGFSGRPSRGRTEGGEGFQGRGRPAGKDFGDRSGGGASRGPRQDGKPGGFKAGGKPSGAREGGFKGGAKPGGVNAGGARSGGGFKGGDAAGGARSGPGRSGPGGSKGGGFKGGGPRSGGPKGGGFKGGGFKGGGSSGGGRPPRGGR